MNDDADIIPLNCIELTMVPSSAQGSLGSPRPASGRHWTATVNWKLELASSADRRGEFIAAGTFEPNSTSTARINPNDNLLGRRYYTGAHY